MSDLNYPVKLVDSFNLLSIEEKEEQLETVVEKRTQSKTINRHKANFQTLSAAHQSLGDAEVEGVKDDNVTIVTKKLLSILHELKTITLQGENTDKLFDFDNKLREKFGIACEADNDAEGDKVKEYLDALSKSIKEENEAEEGSKPIEQQLLGITKLEEFEKFRDSELYRNCFGALKGLKIFLENYPKNSEKIGLNDEEKNIDRLLQQLSALLFNDCLPHKDPADAKAFDLLRILKNNIDECIKKIDDEISNELDDFLHKPNFQSLEANWRALESLVDTTDFSKDIEIRLLDVTKNELYADFSANRSDISNSSLFKKVYTQEYDQYGGKPYGAIIALYKFENTKEDLQWLTTMGKIANVAHCPFIASVGSQFFVKSNDVNQLAEVKDLQGHMSQPMFDEWNAFRDTEEAAYLGFTVPDFMARSPYDRKTNPVGDLNYTETIKEHSDYTWGNAAMLFARNIIKSYETTSWCQTIRGPKNGGQIEDLPRHSFKDNGLSLLKVPVEIVIPDYRELDFAKCGFMALVYQKETSNACFFNSQSIKKAKLFKDPIDSENSQLVTNLSYTLSITKIAHYIKCMMRDNIGGVVDTAFITKSIQSWLSNYVTTVVNPDDLTLRKYPFKAISVETVEREGWVGWYSCIVKVSPHQQFEGLDTELRLETRL
ncbi:MAG: type VI secretion system contractile sheath large subunit [Alteromonadaceae bacterium]|nr:type VI secretion system contractile sheath large subunit [Alteromonadaceae bacterium]